MKITLEFDTNNPDDTSTINRLAGLLKIGDSPAPATKEAKDNPPENKPAKEEKAAKPEPAPEPEEDEGPRVYGASSAGRARRTKEEMKEDAQIEKLAEQLGVKKIPTDMAAEDTLAHMKKMLEDKEPEEEEKVEEEEDFDLDADEEEEGEVVSLEDFRAAVIKAVNEHDADAKAILKKYGKGISAVAEEDRAKALKELAAL